MILLSLKQIRLYLYWPCFNYRYLSIDTEVTKEDELMGCFAQKKEQVVMKIRMFASFPTLNFWITSSV